MTRLASAFKALVKDEEGATMVEYALMLALIAAVCIVTVTALGKKSDGIFDYTEGQMIVPAGS